ncbi:hypothetical protein Scep_014874 [Stephania cephalantha]|uniref:Uncharacterized protein n=1 Tax=Stephania cephalantha TaxID=152367 RepID=A0AAP0J257_9MAGN
MGFLSSSLNRQQGRREKEERSAWSVLEKKRSVSIEALVRKKEIIKLVTTAPSTLQKAYERAMASENFVSTRARVPVASSVPSQSVGGSGGDRRGKRFRQLRQRDRAQNVGSVASPPYVAHTALVSFGPAQSYASAPQQPRPSVLKTSIYQRMKPRVVAIYRVEFQSGAKIGTEV